MQPFFEFPDRLLDNFENLDRQFNRAIEKTPTPGRVHFENSPLIDIKAVLWDIYGTLCGADAGDLEASLSQSDRITQAARETIEHFRLEFALQHISPDGDPAVILKDLYLECIDRSHERSRQKGIECPEVLIENIWLDILQLCLDAGWQNAYDEPLENTSFRVAYTFDTAFQHTYLYPDACHTLENIKSAGICQGIISNAQFYTPVRLQRLLRLQSQNESLRLADLFDESLIVFSYKMGFSKPNPKSFQTAVDHLRNYGITPAQTLYIGNDMLNDIWASQQAGMKSLLFAGDENQLTLRPGDPRCRHLSPDAVATTLKEIPDLIC